MKNPSLVVSLIVIFGLGLSMAEERTTHHHSGGIHSLYPGFQGLYGSPLGLMGSSMYGLGGYGMGQHLGMLGMGHHGLGYGLGHSLGMHHGYGMSHGYGHHPVGHYGMPPTFIPVMGGHKSYKKSYLHNHSHYSPIMSLLNSQYGVFGR